MTVKQACKNSSNFLNWFFSADDLLCRYSVIHNFSGDWTQASLWERICSSVNCIFGLVSNTGAYIQYFSEVYFIYFHICSSTWASFCGVCSEVMWHIGRNMPLTVPLFSPAHQQNTWLGANYFLSPKQLWCMCIARTSPPPYCILHTIWHMVRADVCVCVFPCTHTHTHTYIGMCLVCGSF